MTDFTVRVEGADQAVRALRTMEPETAKQVGKVFAGDFAGAAEAAKANVAALALTVSKAALPPALNLPIAPSALPTSCLSQPHQTIRLPLP